MSRLDYFLTWGNGFEKSLDIIHEIRKDNNFQILAIYRKQLDMSMEAFVKKVYESDTVPWEHLIAKSRYLLNFPPKITFVLTLNKSPDERYFGEGPFRHIQCKKVKDLKEVIRNKFNPRRPDGTRTENHVVHGSDYESQVDHILNILDLPKKERFLKRPNSNINTSFFLNPFKYKRVVVPLKNLRVSYVSIRATVPLEASIHYLYVKGKKEFYESYWQLHWGINLIEDHSPEKFDCLIKNYKYSDNEEDLIVVRKYETDKLLILDGSHRCSILLAKGHQDVHAALIEEK